MSVNYPTAGYSWEYWYRPLSSNMDLYCSQPLVSTKND